MSAENDLYRVLFESADDAILLIEGGRFVECNASALELFGCARGDLIGKVPSDLAPAVQPDGRRSTEVVRERFDTALAGEPQRFEWMQHRLDGSEFYARMSLRRVDVGSQTLLRVALADITHEREREIERARYRQVLETSTDFIGIAMPDGAGIYVNPAGLQMVGYTADEFYAGMNMSSFQPDLPSDVLDIVVRDGVWAGETMLVSKDGRVIPVSQVLTAMRDERGQVVSLATIARDISERKRAEEAVQESEAKFKGIFDLASDALHLIEDGKFVANNARAIEMYGYRDEAEMLGATPLDVSPERQPDGQLSSKKAIKYIERAVAGEPQRFYWKHMRHDTGELFDVEVSLSGISIGGKRYLLSAGRDISERIRAEQERERLIERRAQQARVSAQVSQALAGVPQLDELFRRVVTLVKEQLGYYHAQIFRYDVKQERMVVVSGYGEAGAKMVAAKHGLAMGSGVVGTAAATGESVLAANVRENPDWQPNSDLPDTQAELAVPVMLRGEVLGVLDVQSDRAGALTDDDRLLLESISGPIAVAMEASQLLEEARMFRRFAEASGQGFGIADMEGRIVYVNSTLCRMLGEESPAHAVGKPIDTYYAPEMQQKLQNEVLPTLIRGEQWTGELVVISLDGRVTPTLENYFVIRDQEGNPRYLADVLTDMTERRQAEAEMDERLRELNTLYRMVSREGWQAFQEQSALPAGYLFDPAEFAVQDVDEQDPAAALGAPVDSVSADAQARVVSMPLMVRGEPIGVVGFEHDSQSPFAPEEQELVQAILDQAAEALESARLTEMNQRALAESKDQAQRLAMLNEMSAQLSEATRREEILSIVAANVGQIIDADRSSVSLLTESGDHLEVLALDGEAGAMPVGAQLPVKGMAIGQVVRENRMLLTPVRPDSEFADLRALSEQGLRWILSAPLVVGGEVIGTLNVGRSRDEPYTGRDETLMRQIGSLLSDSIERNQLLTRTRAALAEAEATHRRYLRQTWDEFLAGYGAGIEGYVAGPDGLTPTSDFWTPEMAQAIAHDQMVTAVRGEQEGGRPRRWRCPFNTVGRRSG